MDEAYIVRHLVAPKFDPETAGWLTGHRERITDGERLLEICEQFAKGVKPVPLFLRTGKAGSGCDLPAGC